MEQEYLDFAINISKYAKEIMLKYFNTDNDSKYKGDNTIVTVAVFSLALVKDGVPIIGVVYDVFTDTLYTAIKNQGAYRHGERIFVNHSKLDDIQSIAHYDMFPSFEYNVYDAIKELGKSTYFVSIGSVIRASMCVAEGNFNLVIFPGTKHKNCDIAAVKVIVEESGGIVRNLFGNEQRYDESIEGAIVCNKEVYPTVVDTLKKYIGENNG